MGDDQFSSEKARVLAKADLSRKGSVDAAITPLVHYLNTLDAFYTTSSCSGRISVFCEDGKTRKKECKLLLMSHDPISRRQLVSVLSEDVASFRGYTFFKFEPFILHLMCKTMEDAQTTLQVAVGTGFRNSGISFGKKGKIMLAIRSTHSLEVPVCLNGKLLVSEEYLQHLVDMGNSKLHENMQRIERFFSKLREVSEESKEAQQTKHRQYKTRAKEHWQEGLEKKGTDQYTSSETHEQHSDDEDLLDNIPHLFT